jgi:excinuclease UvrABC nuclease subunit
MLNPPSDQTGGGFSFSLISIEDPEYNFVCGLSDKYKDRVGIYIIYDGETCAYVGKADCLMSRMRYHFRRFKVTKIHFYDMTEVIVGLTYKETKDILRVREAQLIHKLNPVHNIVRPKMLPIYNTCSSKIQRMMIHEMPSLA